MQNRKLYVLNWNVILLLLFVCHTMNIDFILFSAPKTKYNLVDFWGQTIFIPIYKPIDTKIKHKNTILSSLTNCYKANKSAEVYFSIQSALSQQMGELTKIQSQVHTVDQTNFEQQQLSHHIPCLYLDSMVSSKYLMLYFHASGQDIKTSYGLLNYIRNSFQVNVLAMEYPGYSIYKGSPNTQQINQNAANVYKFAVSKLGFQQKYIIVMGRSIGTGVALELLKTKNNQVKFLNPRCLVLISPFSSVKNLAKQFVGPLGTLITKQSYDNIQNIMSTRSPVFILHGKKDSLISHEHSKQLISNCYNKKILVTPQNMTHSSFDYYTDLIDPLRQFLHTQGVNFYEQHMKGPTIPTQLFKIPQKFNF